MASNEDNIAFLFKALADRTQAYLEENIHGMKPEEAAVTAFLRQEFGASVAAIIGFVDILIEDARRPPASAPSPEGNLRDSACARPRLEYRGSR